MCNKLCTYRKYISANNDNEYDLTENPHIILAAKENESVNNLFVVINPTGPGGTNLRSTNFHPFYLEIYNAWKSWTLGFNAGGIISLSPTPSFSTDNGIYDAFNPFTGMITSLPLSITTNFPSYNIISSPTTTSFTNWSMPPLEFADNISADQYVPKFVYTDTDLDIANAPDTMLLVEFLDVTGLRCKY